MKIKTILRLLPNRVFCRELKLLYKSGRLFEGLQGRNINDMALTKIEKMVLKWAMSQWRKSKRDDYYNRRRESVKLWATRLAITGEDHGFDEITYPHTYTISPSPTLTIPDRSHTLTSIGLNVGKVGVAVSDPTRTTSCSQVFQTLENRNRKEKESTPE